MFGLSTWVKVYEKKDSEASSCRDCDPVKGFILSRACHSVSRATPSPSTVLTFSWRSCPLLGGQNEFFSHTAITEPSEGSRGPQTIFTMHVRLAVWWWWKVYFTVCEKLLWFPCWHTEMLWIFFKDAETALLLYWCVFCLWKLNLVMACLSSW